jgi:hypothetical protein
MEKYYPLSIEEFNELAEVIDSITVEIPGNKTDYIWSKFNRINGRQEPKPCTSGCGGAARHWARAVDGLREFVNQRR